MENIYHVNNKTDHILEKHIFYRKKEEKRWYFLDFRLDPLFHDTDPDPYQNETDPKH